MKNEIIKKENNLPVKLEELTKFVLVGREKLVSVRAEIRAIDKLELATEVKEQKKEEASMLAGALLDAEAKIGEIIKKIDMTPSKRASGAGSSLRSLPQGITHKQSSAFQTLADNLDIIEQVKAEAKENDDLPTRTEVLRRVAEIKREEVKNKEIPQLPENKYQLIYADPPWMYDIDLSSGATRSPENNYPVMDLEALVKFGEKVKEISNKDCVLFMWITAPKLNWMNPVLDAWGFEYKTNLIWDKIKPNMGHYSSVRHEILIIAGRGNCSPTCDGKTIQSVDSVQSIEKSARHSEKPKEFIEIIEKLYPDYKKIELFARNKEQRKNWTYWGNEV
jgi:N6-adenosine-specific RNA methylase IME4